MICLESKLFLKIISFNIGGLLGVRTKLTLKLLGELCRFLTSGWVGISQFLQMQLRGIAHQLVLWLGPIWDVNCNINVCTGILSGYEGCMHVKIIVVNASVSVFNFEKWCVMHMDYIDSLNLMCEHWASGAYRIVFSRGHFLHYPLLNGSSHNHASSLICNQDSPRICRAEWGDEGGGGVCCFGMVEEWSQHIFCTASSQSKVARCLLYYCFIGFLEPCVSGTKLDI